MRNGNIFKRFYRLDNLTGSQRNFLKCLVSLPNVQAIVQPFASEEAKRNQRLVASDAQEVLNTSNLLST